MAQDPQDPQQTSLGLLTQEAPAGPERQGASQLPLSPPCPSVSSLSSAHLPCSGCCLQGGTLGCPPANPELMNRRNLPPGNSPSFGVLVRRMRIMVWQQGDLLPGGLSFHPRRNPNWPSAPHSCVASAAIPCSYKRHYLPNPACPAAPGVRGCVGAPAVPFLAALALGPGRSNPSQSFWTIGRSRDGGRWRVPCPHPCTHARAHTALTHAHTIGVPWSRLV